jgi:hypothetical protein
MIFNRLLRKLFRGHDTPAYEGSPTFVTPQTFFTSQVVKLLSSPDYVHSDFSNPTTFTPYWEMPIILEPETSLPIETHFRGALFRMAPKFYNFVDLSPPMFYPGRTVTFDRRKMDDRFRHIMISRESSDLSHTYM